MCITTAIGVARMGAFMLVVLLAMVGCAGPDWSKPTKSVADTTHQAVGAFTPIFDVASHLCYREIGLEMVQKRVDLANWGTEPLLGTWAIGAFDKDGDRTPPKSAAERSCVARTAADGMLHIALAALDEYATALGSLAAGGSFDTKVLHDLAMGAGDLTKQIAANSPAATTAATALSTVSAPIGDLANLVIQAVATREIKAAIHDMNPKVRLIIDACRAYVTATRAEARVVRRSLIDGYNDLDKRIAKRAQASELLLKDVLDLYREAVREGDAIANTERSLAEFLRVLEGLQKAHDSLYKAATAPPEQPSFDAVMTAVSGILKDIEALKGLVGNKG
jgi:hypothetical protein